MLQNEFRKQLNAAIADLRNDLLGPDDFRVTLQPLQQSTFQTLSQLQELRGYVVQHFDDHADSTPSNLPEP